MNKDEQINELGMTIALLEAELLEKAQQLKAKEAEIAVLTIGRNNEKILKEESIRQVNLLEDQLDAIRKEIPLWRDPANALEMVKSILGMNLIENR